MKIDSPVPEIVKDISENSFFNFYFLKVDISFIMYVTNLIFSIHVYDITAEGTVSQICYIGQKSETQFPRGECYLHVYKI